MYYSWAHLISQVIKVRNLLPTVTISNIVKCSGWRIFLTLILQGNHNDNHCNQVSSGAELRTVLSHPQNNNKKNMKKLFNSKQWFNSGYELKVNTVNVKKNTVCTSLILPWRLHFCLCSSYFPDFFFSSSSYADRKYHLNASEFRKITHLNKVAAKGISFQIWLVLWIVMLVIVMITMLSMESNQYQHKAGW